MNWKSKKEIIISSFEKMDIDMLEMVLDDDKTYQDAPKYVFIEKISECFNEFQSMNDTHLTAHKGKCVSTNCPNTGCKGYSFLGNNSNYCLNLIFVESNTDFDDIYYCDEFQTIEKIEGIKEKIIIAMFNDELNNFEPTVDYLIDESKYKIAFEEIEKHFDKDPIDKEIYLPWLKKHEELFVEGVHHAIENLYQYEFLFCTLYTTLFPYQDVASKNEVSKIALEEFKSVNTQDETGLTKWLLKHETLGDDFSRLVCNEYVEKSHLLVFKRLKLSMIDFEYSMEFKRHFDINYWQLIEKYTNYKRADFLKNDDNLSTYSILLSEQLKEKGII